jgi:hypothetical protein
MTKLKTLSAIAILATAIASPVFAQDAGMVGPAHHGRAYDQRNFRGAYNQSNGPLYAAPRSDEGRNVEDFGFGGMDRSFPGGQDPSLKPSGS